MPMSFTQAVEYRRKEYAELGEEKQEETPSFTPEMRDLQARGKNPYQGTFEDNIEGSPMHLGLGQCLPNDTHQARERRDFAMSVLDSPEKLMMHAQSEGDSIAGQRLRFMRMLCGMDERHGVDRLILRKHAMELQKEAAEAAANASNRGNDQGWAAQMRSTSKGRQL